jgi:hypothetical protein
MAFAPLFAFSLIVHALVGWRLVPDLAQYTVYAGFAFSLWLVLSTALMPMGLVAQRLAPEPWGHRLTWIGMVCMGVFSSLFALMVVREVVLLIATMLQWMNPGLLNLMALREVTAVLIPIVSIAILAVGYWNARRTAAVVSVDVPVSNLPEALVGFRIAQISDIHVGPTIKEAYLQRIVHRVNRLQADVVAITGDLVDGPVQQLASLVEPLRGLHSTYGSFFVTGNHEYYSGAHAWINALRTLGVTVLMNEHVVIDHGLGSNTHASASLVLAGVTDYSAHHFDTSHQSDPHKAIANAPSDAGFKLLLAHQPRSADAAAKAGFDLQLSGHTHGGQFWPWPHFIRLQQPFTAGLQKLRNMWIYTSRGTGYWGPPMRLGAPSEITLLRLIREQDANPA